MKRYSLKNKIFHSSEFVLVDVKFDDKKKERKMKIKIENNLKRQKYIFIPELKLFLSFKTFTVFFVR